MKKLLITTIVSLFVIGMTANSFAVDHTQTTTLTATAGSFAQFTLKNTPAAYRSTGAAITFKTVDGTSPSGWYYNTTATLGPGGDPNDNKADVGLGVKSNVPFTIKISKGTDTLDGKVGYNVDKAYNWNGTASVEVGTVTPGTGFAGTTADKKWGAVPTTATLFYSSGANAYADFSMGVSFALVPGGLVVGGYSTTITYTMTASV